MQQMTTAEAAPTAPMVSAIETRSPAYPSHLPMYPHHMPSRVTAQAVGDGFFLPFFLVPACVFHNRRRPVARGRDDGIRHRYVCGRVRVKSSAPALATHPYSIYHRYCTVRERDSVYQTDQAAERGLLMSRSACRGVERGIQRATSPAGAPILRALRSRMRSHCDRASVAVFKIAIHVGQLMRRS